MSRLQNTKTNLGYGKNVKGEIINLDISGQQGYLADMASLPSSTDHVKMPLIVKVLRAPVGLTMMDQSGVYVRAYKNMIENMMQSWQGFNRTLSVSVNETQTGHSGEVFQTPTRVSRARSQITSTIVEKDRRPILRFLEDITRFTIGDPEVGHPLLSGFNDQMTDRLADIYSGIIIAYEPDKTFRYVDNAYLVTNFFPYNDIGENTSSRQLQQDGEVPTYNLSWTGFQKVGYKVDELAQYLMDRNRVTGLDPAGINLIADSIDPHISKVDTGFGEQIEMLKKEMGRSPRN